MESTRPADQSIFNQAQFEQIRLNEIMREVNAASINPLAYNEMYSEYNYKIIFRTLTMYYGEVASKFTDTENKKIDELKEQLQKVIDGHDVFIRPKVNSVIIKNPTLRVDVRIWNPIRDGLFKYQRLILKTAQKHGLGNPTKKNPATAALN